MKAIEKIGQTIIGVPKKWQRPSSPPNMETLAYDERIDADHYLDGWLDITSPTYNTETQYLNLSEVDKIFDGENLIGYNWKRVDYTAQQIADNAKNALDTDDSASKVLTRKSDGETYYKRKMDAIERAFNEGLLRVEPIKFANRYFDVALSPLTRGNWASAQTALLTTPTIPASYTTAEKNLLSNFYQQVKGEVDGYVNQSYQRS